MSANFCPQHAKIESQIAYIHEKQQRICNILETKMSTKLFMWLVGILVGILMGVFGLQWATLDNLTQIQKDMAVMQKEISLIEQ